MKNKNLKLLFIALSTLSFQFSSVNAQETDAKRKSFLEEQVLADSKDAAFFLDELSALYFSGHQYNQFAVFLRKAEAANPPGCGLALNYYIGLCRWRQLRRLEEAQDWQEYFDQGSFYRQELYRETEKAVSLCPDSAYALRAQGINWLEHKAQNDSLARGALDKLVTLINGYVKQEGVNIDVIKEVADTLAKEEEPALAKAAYNLYASRLIKSEVSPDKLRQAAESAVADGNAPLAESIYDRYIELIKPVFTKDKLAGELAAIAVKFAAGSDMLYAEKIFAILEGLDGLNEETQYLRAYNLERLKDYPACAREYEALAGKFPQSAFIDEAEFKSAVINTYILNRKEKGLSSWQKIVERNASLEYSAESLYHQGLLAQYRGDFSDARAGYARISELTAGRKDEFADLLWRIAMRSKEIEQSRPIEHNLKSFLDITAGGVLDKAGSLGEFLSNPSRVKKGQQVEFGVQQPQMATGCLVPDFAYLWSGELGNAQPVPAGGEFSTSYQVKGTKVVNVVVVAAGSPAGAALEMITVSE